MVPESDAAATPVQDETVQSAAVAGQEPAAAAADAPEAETPPEEASEAVDGQESAQKPQPDAVDEKITALKAEFAEVMDKLASHCEGRMDEMAEAFDKIDLAKMESLVSDAQAAVDAMSASGQAALAARLTAVEAALEKLRLDHQHGTF